MKRSNCFRLERTITASSGRVDYTRRGRFQRSRITTYFAPTGYPSRFPGGHAGELNPACDSWSGVHDWGRARCVWIRLGFPGVNGCGCFLEREKRPRAGSPRDVRELSRAGESTAESSLPPCQLGERVDTQLAPNSLGLDRHCQRRDTEVHPALECADAEAAIQRARRLRGHGELDVAPNDAAVGPAGALE